MTQTSSGRASVTMLMTLAAATGAVLALVVGAIAIQVGPWANRRAMSAGCPCEGAGATAGNGAPQAQAELVEQNGELRRAFLSALAQNPPCNDARAREPAAPTELPVDAQLAAEEQDDLEPPSGEDIVAQDEAEAAKLQEELNQERVDPVWAPATERETARAVAATGSMRLEGVTCRASLCQVRVTHRDLEKRADDVEKLLGTMPTGGHARVYAPSDEPTTVMYFSREGLLSASASGVPGRPQPFADTGDRGQ